MTFLSRLHSAASGEEGSGIARLTLYINPRFLIPPSSLSLFLFLSHSLFLCAFSFLLSGAFLWMFPIPRPCNSFSSFFPSHYFSHPLWPYLSILPFLPLFFFILIRCTIVSLPPFPVLCFHSSSYPPSVLQMLLVSFLSSIFSPSPPFFLFVLLGRAASLPGFSRPRCECWRRRNERRSCLWSLSLGHLLRQPAPERRPAPQSSFSHPLPTSYAPQPEWRDVRQPKSLYGKWDHNNIKHGKRIRRRGSRSLTALHRSEWRTITALTSALFHRLFFFLHEAHRYWEALILTPSTPNYQRALQWMDLVFPFDKCTNKKKNHDFSIVYSSAVTSYGGVQWTKCG